MNAEFPLNWWWTIALVVVPAVVAGIGWWLGERDLRGTLLRRPARLGEHERAAATRR